MSVLEEYEKATKKKNKVFENILSHLEILVIAIIGVLYVCQGLYQFAAKNATLVEIIGSIVESFIVGLMIYTNLRKLGLRAGRKDENFIASIGYYSNAKEKTKNYREKTPAFCNYKNKQTLDTLRKDLIEDVGLSYTLWKQGFYSKQSYEELNLDKDQIHTLETIKSIKAPKIRPNELYSDLPHYSTKQALKYGQFGQDEKSYTFINGATDALFMFVSAIITGYFGLEPIINADSLAQALWNLIQLIIWISFGVMKYYQSYMFMVNEYRQTHIIQKAEILYEFISIMSKNPHALDEYDDELKYLKKLEEEKENENEQQLQYPIQIENNKVRINEEVN